MSECGGWGRVCVCGVVWRGVCWWGEVAMWGWVVVVGNEGMDGAGSGVGCERGGGGVLSLLLVGGWVVV